MQYHLDTIPVWSAMEEGAECPICALFRKAEQTEVERSLGGSVMEPSARVRVNERGFCQRHHQQLFQQKNRLGHALMVDSHVQELQKKVERLARQVKDAGGARTLFGKRAGTRTDALIAGLEQLSRPCAVCETLDGHMNRYFYTFLHLWKNDAKFKAVWDASMGVGLPHGAELLRHAQKRLPPAAQRELAASVLTLLAGQLKENEEDLAWFTQKFDYRNQDKPWGNSKNALERTVNRLRGYCVGDDAKK